MEKYYFELEYSDGSSVNWYVEMEGSWNEVYATLMMICRGTLMASIANKCTCYNFEGFDVCSYVK